MTEPLVTIDDILSGKKPQVATVDVCLDTDLTTEVNDAFQKLREVRLEVVGRASDPEAEEMLAEAEARFEAAQEARRGSLVRFEFKALGRVVLEAMERQYPVTREQLEAYRAEQKRMSKPATDPPKHDVDRFPPALIAASCVRPVITPEKAEELWNHPNFSKGELAALFQTAWAVNALTS